MDDEYVDDGKTYSHYAACKPFPKSNTVWGADARFDTREWGPKWQRVPGCCRVVHASIPDPIPFYAPERHGWRGVPTRNGLVYDYETGQLMKDQDFIAFVRASGDFLKKAKA